MIRLADPDGTRRRGLDRVSPSALEGGRRIRLGDALHDDQGAKSFGTRIHAWFEQIAWLDEGPPTDEELLKVALDDHLSAAELQDALQRFRAMLQHPDIDRLLQTAAYADRDQLPFEAAICRELVQTPCRPEARREYSFAIRDGEAILTGSIDRLVLLWRGDQLAAADILDFKTDQVSSQDTLHQKAAYYRPQLDAYRRAIATSFRLPPQRIATRLVFVGPGIVWDTTK